MQQLRPPSPARYCEAKSSNMSSDCHSFEALIERGAESAPAFVVDGRPISRGQFAQRIDQTAAWLAAHGVARGDVIAIWLVNRLEWATLLFAAARLGAVIAAVNTRYRSAEVQHLLGLSRAKMLVMQAQFRSIDFPAILAGIGKSAVPDLVQVAVVGGGEVSAQWPCIPFDAFDARYSRPPARHDDVDAPVLLFTTSGTTRGAKTRGAFASNARQQRSFDRPGTGSQRGAAFAAGDAAVLRHLRDERAARLLRKQRSRSRTRRL
jgi:acyl-CoA synthetase (AMP-forming)/AMP-acid ligase II